MGISEFRLPLSPDVLFGLPPEEQSSPQSNAAQREALRSGKPGRIHLYAPKILVHRRATELAQQVLFDIMSQMPVRISPLRVCAWVALISLLVTAIVPVLFFQFPGPKFMPFRYEFMWAVTECLWKPLRVFQISLASLLSYDLRQYLNPYFVAPLVNAPVAFVAAYGFLKLRDRWQRRSRDECLKAGLEPVARHIEAIRTDYPAALQTVPHPAAHAEAVLRDARVKVGSRPYFQPEIKPEASEENDKRT